MKAAIGGSSTWENGAAAAKTRPEMMIAARARRRCCGPACSVAETPATPTSVRSGLVGPGSASPVSGKANLTGEVSACGEPLRRLVVIRPVVGKTNILLYYYGTA